VEVDTAPDHNQTCREIVLNACFAAKSDHLASVESGQIPVSLRENTPIAGWPANGIDHSCLQTKETARVGNSFPPIHRLG
jgi:hypothetical protein